jgi:peptidoglycan/LPS O-acetylase OafA/YrhL
MSSAFRNIRALDGIRGLAIILVMLHHFEYQIPPNNIAITYTILIFDFGWVGVDLFFVLSGFLITSILLDTRKADNYFSSFYARRILRIFPLYYSVLILILTLRHFCPPLKPISPLPADEKLYFLYLTNWLVLWKGHWGPNILGHFWSLAVEEQFYLIWPVFVWLLTPKRLAKTAALGCLAAILVRIMWVNYGGPAPAIAIATVTRMDTLLCGALGAIFFQDAAIFTKLRPWLLRIAWVAAFIVIVGVVVMRHNHGPWGGLLFIETIGFTLMAIGFTALVLYAAATDGKATLFQRVFRSRVLSEFGKYSYGIYVYHVPVLAAGDLAIRPHLPPALVSNIWFNLLYVALLFGVSFLIAMLSYEHFERHFLAMKRYFEPSRVEMPPLAADIGVHATD